MGDPDLNDGGSDNGNARGDAGAAISSKEDKMISPLEVGVVIAPEYQVCETQTKETEKTAATGVRGASKKRSSSDGRKAAENVAKQIKKARTVNRK